MKLDKVTRGSILFRLLISFALITVPLYLLGIGIYSWAQISVKDKIISSAFSNINAYIGNFEDELIRIRALENDCINDENLLSISNNLDILSDYERTMAILRLQYRLTSIKNSSIYISEVNVYVKSLDRVISYDNGIAVLDEKNYKDLVALCKPLPKFIYWNKSIAMYSVIPGIHLNTKQPPFLIEIKFSNFELQKKLDQLNTFKNSGIFIMTANSESDIILNKDEIGHNLREEAKSIIKGNASGHAKISISKKKHLLLFKKSELLNITALQFIPEEEMFSELAEFRIFLILIPLAALFLMLIYSFTINRIIKIPIKKLINSFKRVEEGEFNFTIEHNHQDEFRYLYQRFNFMVKKINSLIDQVYKHKIMSQKAELKQLQSQINPHFLYNSFFIMNTMARLKDIENVERFTMQLGEYFQYITRNASDEVILKNEVNHARIYSEIQALRFSKRIKVNFQKLPEEYLNLNVPRLILQPVIENAFEHGLDKKIKGGILNISFIKHDEYLDIVIEDNGDGVTEDRLAYLKLILEDEDVHLETTGIVNIHRRVKLKFGKDSGLYVDRGDTEGIKIVIRIAIEGKNMDV